jgi:hypothetical protein
MWGAIAAGAAIGSALGLIGNNSSNRTQRKIAAETNETNIALQREATAAQTEQSQLDRAYQEEFAKHGVSWKAADAREAGLDPLAAMGSNTFYSPVAQPVQAARVEGYQHKSSGPYLAKMGQDISTNIERFLTQDQRKQQNEGIKLDNQYKEIRNLMAFDELNRQQSQAPVAAPSAQATKNSLPIAGQPDSAPESNAIVVKKPEITLGKHKGKTAGLHHFGTDYVDDDGYLWEMPQEKLADTLESDTFSNVKRFIIQGGKYVKGLFVKPKEPKTPPSKGHVWVYDKLRGQWREVRKGSHTGGTVHELGTGRKFYRGKIHY